jgi:hypothetical protein
VKHEISPSLSASRTRCASKNERWMDGCPRSRSGTSDPHVMQCHAASLGPGGPRPLASGIGSTERRSSIT